VRIDRSDDGDERPDAADVPRVHKADTGRDAGQDRDLAGKDAGHEPETGSAVRVERALEHRATVDAVNRAHAIEQGYARVQEIEEKTVTPAMRRIEAEDPDRILIGMEQRLKGQERLSEKIESDMRKWGVTAEQAFTNIKDAIRYTLEYPEDRYTDGVVVDCQRMEVAGFELAERRNSWDGDQYKGINSRWRLPEDGQLFEVQFHTRASFEAKEETHAAYERLRTLPEDHEDIHKLRDYQREVTAKVPVPPSALDIPNYP
jgi:DNA-directed RNA polymerase subunit K/omega